MMKKVIYGSLVFAPVMALAADLSNLDTLVGDIGNLINNVLPVLFAIALVFFFWGVIQFLRAAGDEKAQATGKSHMIYGIVALAVMVSVYGLINFLTESAGLDNTQIEIPEVPTR